MWIDGQRKRAGEAWARLRQSAYRWIARRFQPLWRRLGDYCDCRRAELAELGARHSYPSRLRRIRKSYDVYTTRLLATPPRDNPIARSNGFVVSRTEMMDERFPNAGMSVYMSVLCSCDRWRPANMIIGPPAAGNPDLEDRVYLYQWQRVRTFRSQSLAEQQIGQIIYRTSPISRTKGLIIAIIISIIASLITAGILAIVT